MTSRFSGIAAHKRTLALLATAAVIATVPALSGCDLTRNTLTSTERSLDYSRQDMRQALAPRPLKDEKKEAPIPEFESYVADPALDEKPAPLVTISVNQTVPLRDIFFELAEQADVDIEIDPNIRGSIIFSARKRPFNEVLERISDLAGLRYTVKNGVYRVELDTPYLQSYKLDYLGVVRDAKSDISYSVSLGGSGGGGEDGGSTETSSGAQIEATYKADLWTEIETNVKDILSSSDKTRTMSSRKDPVAMTQTPPTPVPGNYGPGQAPDPSGAGTPQINAPAAAQPSAAAPQQQVPNTSTPTLPYGDVSPQAGDETPAAATPATASTSGETGVTQLVPTQAAPSPAAAATTTGTAAAPAGAPQQAAAPTAAQQQASTTPPSLTVQTPTGSSDDEAEEYKASYTLNRQAGIISVYAPQRQQKQIAKYLEEVKKRVSSQVLIEARVLEVNLSDEYAAGIDWNTVNLINNSSGLGNLSFNGSFLKGTLTPALSGSSFGVNYASEDLTLAIDAISRFGTVHAVSSPRMTVLNNQMAILNVAENIVFFKVDVTAGQSQVVDGGTINQPPTVTTEARTVPEGLIMTVMPSIDLDTQEVVLALRPTLTRITTSIPDPAIPLGFAFQRLDPADYGDPQSLVPQVAVQEMDSVVRLKSGSVLVMGGLMSDRTTGEEVGVPVLSDIPLLGAAFRSHNDKISKTELVIFLKATIIPSQYTHETDRELYKDFGQDRRPLNM